MLRFFWQQLLMWEDKPQHFLHMVMENRSHLLYWYCWWKKSQTTTWDVWYSVNDGINYQPQLVIAGFFPSRVGLAVRLSLSFLSQSRGRIWSCSLQPWSPACTAGHGYFSSYVRLRNGKGVGRGVECGRMEGWKMNEGSGICVLWFCGLTFHIANVLTKQGVCYAFWEPNYSAIRRLNPNLLSYTAVLGAFTTPERWSAALAVGELVPWRKP